MGNRFLKVQISIFWVVFAVKTVTLLWQPAKAQDIATSVTPVQSFSAETYFIPIRITKGPQLISEINIPLLIPEWWRLCGLASFPGPRPASRRLQYEGKLGEGLGGAIALPIIREAFES